MHESRDKPRGDLKTSIDKSLTDANISKNMDNYDKIINMSSNCSNEIKELNYVECNDNSDTEHSMDIPTPYTVPLEKKSSVSLPKIDKKKNEVLTPQADSSKAKKLTNKNYSKF